MVFWCEEFNLVFHLSIRWSHDLRFVCSQETDYPVHEQIDLYDDVISPSANNGDAPEDRDYLDNLPTPGGTEGNKGAPPNVVYTYTGKRIALYIGNLTWVCTHSDTPQLGTRICISVQ